MSFSILDLYYKSLNEPLFRTVIKLFLYLLSNFLRYSNSLGSGADTPENLISLGLGHRWILIPRGL
jgi:hypothetical protein